MRKLFIALALALALLTTPVRAATDPNPPRSYPEYVESLGPWNRSAVVKDQDGNVVTDLGEHDKNPFPTKAACIDGLDEDTRKIYTWLKGIGAPIETLDVVVKCDPAEGTGI